MVLMEITGKHLFSKPFLDVQSWSLSSGINTTRANIIFLEKTNIMNYEEYLI